MQVVRTIPRLPPRARSAHKGDFGTVLVVAGSEGMLGAAVLCATAALRGGAGLVRTSLPRALQPLLPLAVPCATTLPRTETALHEAVNAATAAVVGPGLGATLATRSLVRAVLRTSRVPVVLDADALNVLAPLRAPLVCRGPIVLTPHPGEAARLLGCQALDVQADRPAALRALCQRSGAVVVLKGAGTLVADGVSCFTNRTGNPGMATGGSGDVLAGLLAALLAQGMQPFAAACLAVHVHGKAGDLVAERYGERGLVASDLPLAIAEVMS
ncbi:MAG: NAD(P)H-hydrate dehydratase [Planctomycetota bacterium]